MKYIILADSVNPQPFIVPRQLTRVFGESLIERTIRLLKENGVKDIVVTSHDKRFDNLGAERYEPKFNIYNGKTNEGYWLNAFPIELLVEPITFLFGDVYYSEDAIKKIAETETDSTLFFCTYNNKDERYIKHHDEPLAYKVVDYDLFKEHIEKVKKAKDDGLCCREPIVWELYRSINGQELNEHIMTNNYIAINDESCDIDCLNDIILLEEKLGGNNMVKAITIKQFSLEEFDKLKNVKRANTDKDKKGTLYLNDTFNCDEEMAKYLTGENSKKERVIQILEVIPDVKPKKTTTKKKTTKAKK